MNQADIEEETTMSDDTKSPAPETREPQKITPQKGEAANSAELDAQQLDKVAGGTGGLHGAGPLGPGRGG
jgi:hypothetical protein